MLEMVKVSKRLTKNDVNDKNMSQSSSGDRLIKFQTFKTDFLFNNPNHIGSCVPLVHTLEYKLLAKIICTRINDLYTTISIILQFEQHSAIIASNRASF